MLNHITNNTCRNRVENRRFLKKKNSLFEPPDPRIATCVQTYKHIEHVHIIPTTLMSGA